MKRETTSIRVVHVAPTMFGSDGLFGGGERYPLELARALARRGDVDCELVTFGARSRHERDPSGLQVRVLRARAHLRGHPVHPVAFGLADAVRGADVVHTHHLRSAPSRLAALVARVGGSRVVTTDHGLGGGGWGGLLPRLFHRFLTVSRYSALTLRTPPGRTRVIYGGADPVRFRPDPPAERGGVLFVGRLTPHKGLDHLLRALPPDAELTVVGTGGHDPGPPERDYPELLRRLANGKNVRFHGPASEQELPGLYRRAAVFVLPSVERTCYGRTIAISELLGLSALEAMASGTPVVASRVGGLPEVVRNGETGFLVDPGDVTGLNQRLSMLLTEPGLAHRMGDNARDHVGGHFTWEACAERCAAAYRELFS